MIITEDINTIGITIIGSEEIIETITETGVTTGIIINIGIKSLKKDGLETGIRIGIIITGTITRDSIIRIVLTVDKTTEIITQKDHITGIKTTGTITRDSIIRIVLTIDKTTEIITQKDHITGIIITGTITRDSIIKNTFPTTGNITEDITQTEHIIDNHSKNKSHRTIDFKIKDIKTPLEDTETIVPIGQSARDVLLLNPL